MRAWAFLPALGGALAHAPVLRFDLNKTLRGALVMSSGTTVASLVLTRQRWFSERLPAELREAPPAVYGFLLGAGLVLGELPNSFVKRQLGIPPGDRRRSPLGVAIAVYDQADFVPVAALALRPLWRISTPELAGAVAVVAGVHSVVNVVGYVIGARSTPI